MSDQRRLRDLAAARIAPEKMAWLEADKARFRAWYAELIAQPGRMGPRRHKEGEPKPEA